MVHVPDETPIFEVRLLPEFVLGNVLLELKNKGFNFFGCCLVRLCRVRF